MRFLSVRLPASFVLLLRRPAAFSLVVAGSLLVLAHWVVLALTVHPQTTSVVLHYNVYFGIDKVGSWQAAFLLPLYATAIMVGDVGLAAWLSRRDHWLAQGILLAGALTAALLLLGSSVVRLQFG